MTPRAIGFAQSYRSGNAVFSLLAKHHHTRGSRAPQHEIYGHSIGSWQKKTHNRGSDAGRKTEERGHIAPTVI